MNLSEAFSAIEGLLLKPGITPGVSGSDSSSAKDVIPGDVNIISVMIMSEDQSKTMDLTHHCKVINIYESILSPIIIAELSIYDAINMLESFPVICEEYVKIEFSTPGAKSSASYLLRVNHIKDKNVLSNNMGTTYTLECVSSESFKSADTLVAKELNGSVSSGVKGILTTELSTQKKIKIEDTKGVEKFLMTRMTPFVAIDCLRKRAISKKYESSSFVFFENRNGFNFSTIEKLFDDGQKGLENGDKIFSFSSSTNMNARDVTVRNIISYNKVSHSDTLTKIKNGGMKTKVFRLDTITGEVKEFTKTISELNGVFKKAKSSDAPMNTSSFENKHSKTTSVTQLVPYSSDRPESFIPEKLSTLPAFVQRIVQNIIHVHVYGDSDLTASDMVVCNFPEVSGMTKDKKNARLDSGNYLISKLRHMIVLGDRAQHTMSLELIKGTFMENV